MKTVLLFLLISSYTASAQLAVNTGAQFSLAGSMQLTLQNTDLLNDGNFTAGNSLVSFTGDSSSFIKGNQVVQFFGLEISKSNNNTLRLEKNIAVDNRIVFSDGFLNLNGFDANLGTTGRLEGEQESSRVIGPNGGTVLYSSNLNFPANADAANLGITITANQNLGNVIIRRGHQSQVNGAGTGSSIFRYYDIIPDNNTGLNATIRLRYMDGELNNLVENSLQFFKSIDNINWVNLGSSSKNIVANFVEKTGINSFGRFTLSNSNGPLPVQFISFNTKCETGKVLLTWKTAQEQGSSHFNIERSSDAAQWTVTGNLPAAGNSNNERSYSFTDNDPAGNNFYRIAEHDINGRVQYTGILRSSCHAADLFSIGPNPVHDMLFISIVTQHESPVIMKLFDSKGALVKTQKANLLQGSNQLIVDMRSLANGTYSLSVLWDNGAVKKTVQVVKQ